MEVNDVGSLIRGPQKGSPPQAVAAAGVPMVH